MTDYNKLIEDELKKAKPDYLQMFEWHKAIVMPHPKEKDYDIDQYSTYQIHTIELMAYNTCCALLLPHLTTLQSRIDELERENEELKAKNRNVPKRLNCKTGK